MLASVASIPLGPAATTAPRELLTFVSAVVGIVILLRASLAVPLSKRWFRWSVRSRWLALIAAGVLTLGTLVTFAGDATMIVTSTAAQSYATDIISLAHENAQLVLAGRNPYTSDDAYRTALARFPLALGTPMRGPVFGTGYDHPAPSRIDAVQRQYVRSPGSESGAFAPATLHSYPALSFLLYVPLLWLGIQNVLLLHILVYWCLFAWLVWLTPVGWRHWGALVALAAMPTVAASLIVTNEVIAIALVLTAWHFRHVRRRAWLSAIMLGLACAYKQYAWFFVPFFAVELLSVYGWREALKRGLAAFGAFLLPNLPYIIASPQAWFASLWLPMSEPLFATGMGFIALPVGHLMPYGLPLLYAMAEVGVMAALVWVFARWRSTVGDGALALALVPLFFAFRSPPNYFAFLPWLALYAANRRYALTVSQATSPVVQAWEAALARMRRRLAWSQHHIEEHAGLRSVRHEPVVPWPLSLLRQSVSAIVVTRQCAWVRRHGRPEAAGRQC